MSRPTTMGFPACMERISRTHSSAMAALSVRVVSMVFPAKMTEYLEVVGLKVMEEGLVMNPNMASLLYKMKVLSG